MFPLRLLRAGVSRHSLLFMFVENKEKIYCQFDERLRASYTNSTQVNTPMSEHVVFYSFSNSTQVNTPMSEHVVFYSFSNLTEVKPPMSVLLLWKGKPCRCMCFSFPVPSLLLVVKFLFKNLKIHRASFSTKGEGNLSNHWSTSQSYDTNIILILMN